MVKAKLDLKSRRILRLMDEVYREMFRLEAHVPGAEMGLALALLRSWVASDLPERKATDWMWLRNVCPVCLNMIEKSLERDRIAMRCPTEDCGPKQG